MALAVAVAFISAESSWLYEGGYGIVALAMVAGPARRGAAGFEPARGVLESRALVGLGLISYGVYLWHWPISLWVTEGGTGLDDVSLFVVARRHHPGGRARQLLPRRAADPHGKLRLTRGRSGIVVAAVAALSVTTLLVVPALAFSTTRHAPRTAAPPSQVVAVNAGYAAAPRCDSDDPNTVPIAPGHRIKIQLEGNSLAGEIRSCLRGIMGPRGVTFETVNPPKFLLCDDLPAIKDQIKKTKPDAGILFAFVAFDPRCGEPWHAPVDELVAAWKAAGTHVYLIPSTPLRARVARRATTSPEGTRAGGLLLPGARGRRS